jgi:hypothetical protein
MIQTICYTIFFGVALSTTFIPEYRYFNELSSRMGLKVVMIEKTIFQMDRKLYTRKVGMIDMYTM